MHVMPMPVQFCTPKNLSMHVVYMYIDKPHFSIIKKVLVSLYYRVGCFSGNAAVVVAVPAHFDVAFHPPAFAPAVLHDPKILSVVASVADSQDSVVQLSLGAGWLVVDSTAVQLKAVVGGVDGNRDWTDSGNSLGEGVLILMSHICVALFCRTNVSGVEAAFFVPSHVGVAALGVNSVVFDDVLEGIVHESSVASLVALCSGAVHEVLLTQGDQVPRGIEVLSLQGAGGTEGPA